MLLFHLAKHPYRSILAFRYYHFLNGSEDRNMWHEAPRRFYEFIHAFKTSAINPFSPNQKAVPPLDYNYLLGRTIFPDYDTSNMMLRFFR